MFIRNFGVIYSPPAPMCKPDMSYVLLVSALTRKASLWLKYSKCGSISFGDVCSNIPTAFLIVYRSKVLVSILDVVQTVM